MRQKYTVFQHGTARGVCIPELEPHLEFFTVGMDVWLSGQPIKVFLERPNRVAAWRLPPTIRVPETPPGQEAGIPVVSKRFGWRSSLHRVLRPLTGSKALRTFRIAMVLREAGVATPRPLIAWESSSYGPGTQGCYISEEIPEAVTFRQWLKSSKAPEPERAALLTELARLVRGMHDAGVWHRDLTIGNFLVVPKPFEGNRIFLIDLSRAVNLGRVPILLRFLDLARMKLGDLWPDCFEAYCLGHPEWKSWRPVLDSLIWLRRRKMEMWKRLKTR